MSYPAHQIIEKTGQQIVVRQESHGCKRTLSVWSVDNCIAKLRTKNSHEAMEKFFVELSAWLCEEVVDPMIRDWRQACFANMELAWERVVAQSATIEEFGFDTLEEFGFD